MKPFTVRSGDAALAVESAGTGAPVVLLHAGVADRRMWRRELDALAHAGFHAYAYDRRGFGESLHADDAWSQAGDLIAVLDAFARTRPAILVGCSQGGRLAIDVALAHPSRVAALMLVAPAISGAPKVDALPAPIQAWVERLERAEAANDVDAINALEAHAWLDGPLAPEGRVAGPARTLFLSMNEIALRSEARGTEAAPPSAYDRLDRIGTPTLVAWGDLDFPAVVATCEHAARTIKGARRHVFAGAAHLPNLEQPDAFAPLLVDFCRSTSERR